MIGASWRTTTMGILSLIAALGLLSTCFVKQFDDDPTTIPLWEQAWDALALALVGLGLMQARDNKVTSEAAGAKP